MRLTHVFAYNVSTSFVDVRFLPNNFDAFATRTRCWFHYVHVLKVTDLSIYTPPFKVLGKDVRCWRDVEWLPIKTTHSLYVSPHKIFAADAPTSGKMIGALILVNVLNSLSFKQACPENVPSTARTYKMKASHLQRIDNPIVSVG